MATSEFSKAMIAQGMKDLLKKQPLESISIGDLARQCQISRSTIYYHFKDKYDIVSWIFHSEIQAVVRTDKRVGTWTENLLEMCLYLQRNREFYIRVLRDIGQNSFTECLISFCKEVILHLFQESQADRVLTQKQIQTITDVYAYGIVGLISDWSRRGMATDPASTVQTIRELISGSIYRKMLSLQESPDGPADSLAPAARGREPS